MKIKSGLLFLSFLVSCNLFSQDTTTVWKKNVIDSLVTLNLPGNMETSRLMDRLTVGKLEYEQIFFMFIKMDVVEPIQLAKDTIELRDGYDKQLKGYLKQTPGGVVIGQEEIREGDYIGRYAKIKMNREGLDFYIEYKMFVLNDDVYTIQIVYPPSIENTTTDLRKRFLNSLIIASTAKQVK